MTSNKKISNGDKKEEFSSKRKVAYVICFSVLIFISAILQSTCLSFFGKVPALTLALICALGFVFGEKVGAIAGVITGIFIDVIGSVGFSFSPIVYMLCGYCCGVFVEWFLSKNLPSFLIYAAIAGGFREIFTFIQVGLFSKSFSFWRVFTDIVIPEYFSYLVCILPAYGAVYGIYRLFKGKDRKEKRIDK